MKEKLIKLLDSKNNIALEFKNEGNHDCLVLVRRQMFYAIDALWQMDEITLEDKYELEILYKCAYCF